MASPTLSSAVPQRNDSMMRRRPTAGLSPAIASPESIYSPSSPLPGRDSQHNSNILGIRDPHVDTTYPRSPRPFPLDAFGLTVRVEDVDDSSVQPTVLLVNKSTSNDSFGPIVESVSVLESIPLTPQAPEAAIGTGSQQSRGESKSSIQSIIPRLPTPDFASMPNPLRQALIAPLSFFGPRTPLQATKTSKNSISSPISDSDCHISLENMTAPLLRGNSDRLSHKSDTSIRSQLLTETTERFTNKFPLSSSTLQYLKTRAPKDATKPSTANLQGKYEELVPSESGKGLGLGELDGKWTIHKWVLLVSVICVFACGICGLIMSVLTWFRVWSHADVVLVCDNDIIIFITIASSIYLLASLLGTVGTLMNSRAILTFYAMLLWPALVSLLVVGYASYKRVTFSLDRKINERWSRNFDDLSRLIVQNSLHCCGYYNPLHQAVFSKRCYPRTSLPGCKGKLYRFEKAALHRCYTIAFALVPLSLLSIIISLLCSNHVNSTFGKGLTPGAYRLSMKDVHASARALLEHLEEVARIRSTMSSPVDEDTFHISGGSLPPDVPIGYHLRENGLAEPASHQDPRNPFASESEDIDMNFSALVTASRDRHFCTRKTDEVP